MWAKKNVKTMPCLRIVGGQVNSFGCRVLFGGMVRTVWLQDFTLNFLFPEVAKDRGFVSVKIPQVHAAHSYGHLIWSSAKLCEED